MPYYDRGPFCSRLVQITEIERWPVNLKDPAVNFQPDTGKIEVYRSAGGNGVRLDASSGFAGAQITPHYDSLLVKISVRGATFEVARRKMLRALVEFRIRGVKTNIPFLFRVLSHENFVKNTTWTTFIDDTPDLFKVTTLFFGFTLPFRADYGQ
jgi:pyruvate carboxylase